MKFVSFFSGALGLDLGIEHAGLTCLAACENDRHACETIRKNRPELPLYSCDVRELTHPKILSELGLRSGDIDAVVGGPPCQAFSTAGKRRSLEDERGNVFLHFVRLATALKPRWLVIENVRGLLSAPLEHRPHLERGPQYSPLRAEESPGGALARVIAILENEGYAATFELYDAANFGAPQRRERVVLIAGRDGERVPHLVPTHDRREWVTFQEATSGLAEEHEYVPLRENQIEFIKLLGPGQNWRDLPKDLHRAALGGAYESGGGRVGFFRRVAWDAPTPTLTTNPTMPATLLAHPTELRPLSVQEYRRVQGFPDDWEFSGATSAKYRLLGNAVPIALAKQIGLHLVTIAEGRSRDLVAAGRTSRYRNTSEREWAEKYCVAGQGHIDEDARLDRRGYV